MATRELSVIAATALAAFAIGGCGDDSGSGDARSSSARIPQPPLGEMRKLPLAPESRRVDLAAPSFSNPTDVTNPLFPISEIHSSLLLGNIEGKPLRVEITLIPETKTVDWDGRRVETLESQFLAYLDGRIHEVATDLYAQADDGSVWYFGEDVFNYARGVVADTEGTWRAGRGSPAAMIMPADPEVGDVYRAENYPGVVFEQVTVKKVGQRVQGPTGPIEGAMVAEELHMEGDLEAKTFAPDYGEFFSGQKGNVEANALTVPADALDVPAPRELQTLSTGAADVFEAAGSKDWDAAAAAAARMTRAFEALRTRGVPRLLAAQLRDALDALERAVRARGSRSARQAALDVASAGLDIQLRYRPPVEIDWARFDLRTRQLMLDAAAADKPAVTGDVTTLQWIRDRLALEPSQATDVDAQLRYMEAATEAREFAAVEDAGARLRKTMAGHLR